MSDSFQENDLGADAPRLIPQVTATPATVPKVVALPAMQAALQAHEHLPQRQLVDAGYVEATALVTSQQDYGIELCGTRAISESSRRNCKAS